MSIFKHWTEYEVSLHNTRLKSKDKPSTEGCADESKLHQQIEAELKRRGWYYVRSRMDRRTTTAKGVPDFIVAAPGAKTYWIEAKTAKGKLRVEQAGALHWLGNLGHQSYIVRNFQEFLKVIE